MKRKIKPVDLNDFLEADDINTTSIKGEMRKLWPAIHQKLTTGGWTARDVVKWFNDQGVSMSVELFRVYLNELDREQGYNRAKKLFLGDIVSDHTDAHQKVATSNSPRIATNPNTKTGSVVSPVVKSGVKRKSILRIDKGVFGELDPPPADGVVDLKQK